MFAENSVPERSAKGVACLHLLHGERRKVMLDSRYGQWESR